MAMLASNPSVAPRVSRNQWYQLLQPGPSTSEPFSVSSISPSSHNRPGTPVSPGVDNRRDGERTRFGESPAWAGTVELAALVADERIIASRKANIRDFGSSWIKPPGITKTLQAMIDEQAEREEQEAIARRDAALQEAMRAQEDQIRSQRTDATTTPADPQRRRTERSAETGHEGNATERGIVGARFGLDGDVSGDETDGRNSNEDSRDLDAEIPEAEAFQSSDGVFGEDSYGDFETQLHPRPDGVNERNLGDSTFESGSYQHTDTELEEDSSGGDEQDPVSATRRHIGTIAGVGTSTASPLSSFLAGGADNRLRRLRDGNG